MYEISWPNIAMLSASIPSYESEDDKKVKAKKPKTFKDGEIRNGDQFLQFFN